MGSSVLLTLRPEFEVKQLGIRRKWQNADNIYKGLSILVYASETALAEADRIR